MTRRDDPSLDRVSMTHRMGRSRSTVAFALLLVLPVAARGQGNSAEKKPTLEKIQALHLQKAAGPVPVYYSAGFEARALKYQQTIIACQQWYDKQVGKHVDFTLAVLNKADWEKTTPVEYPMPHNVGVYRSLPPPMVILPARFEDFPNSAEFTDDPELLMENVAYHELGHIYAHFIDMEIDDNLLAEMYANVFMVSFVRAQRPDMLFFLQGPPAKLPPQRYTSMEDLQYLADDVGMTNYGWFQFQVYRMCDLLLRDKALLQLLSELKKTFGDRTRWPFSDVAAKLEVIRPGIGKEMGALWKPTTLPDSQSKPCGDDNAPGKDSDLVVLNASSKPVKVTSGKDAPVVVASNSWYAVSGPTGAFLKIDTGACFVFGDEPSIARIPSK
jgi:hypothetical protein